jgi:hypothetical protein
MAWRLRRDPQQRHSPQGARPVSPIVDRLFAALLILSAIAAGLVLG